MDMRQSFDGLAGMVANTLKRDSFSGHLFVFFSRCKSKVKVLFWDSDGYVIWYKRLEVEVGIFGVSKWVDGQSGSSVEVDSAEFAMLLNGFDLQELKRRKRYSRDPVLQ
jgi:transposase